MATHRKTVLANNQIYHVYNRGIEKRTIFGNKRECERAINTVRYYSFTNSPLKFSKFLVQPKKEQEDILKSVQIKKNQLVEIIAYCLMPNHFHLLLKQLQDNGISRFISNFTNSYTKYFNTKHERIGPLVQGLFKAVFVENDDQLVHLSRYIHLNPVSSFIIKVQELENYPWSSLKEYLGLEKDGFCEKQYVLGYFKSVGKYKQFVLDQISYARELEKIKHLSLED